MEQMGFFIVGFVLIRLGLVNMEGDISSIHWYNRTKVKREDYSKYGRLMGLGSLITGATLIVSGVLGFFLDPEFVAWIVLLGVVTGLILTLYAQFKYNKGIF